MLTHRVGVHKGAPCAFSPDESNLYEVFEAVASGNPDAVAVIGESASMTYGQLAGCARGVSHGLRGRGVTAGCAVGIMMERTPEIVSTLLGILHSGACYVPLDPKDPWDRNQAILDAAGCRFIVGQRAVFESLRPMMERSASAAELLVLEDLEVDGAPAWEEAAPGGDQLAYILFTSGSTGRPKGVEIEHRNVLNLLHGVRELIGFTAADRFLATSTIGFDISVPEIFLPLITGGAAVLRDRDLLLDPHRLAAEVRRHGVTVMQTGPSVWAVILHQVPNFPRVRVAITTSEPISPELALRLLPVGEVLWNLYGPTETTVWSTGQQLTGAILANRPDAETTSRISAPIGVGLFGTTVAIRSDAGDPVLHGQIGELCLGGPCLARGYRNDPRLTAERFRAATPDGEREYLTGDLVCWNARGELEYFGRKDDQLKIRGIRIEPREVETAILSHPAVANTAATWYESGAGGKSIVAAVVIAEGARATSRELHAWAEQRLPRPVVPSRFVFVEQLPLTPSGKADRGAIRKLADKPQEAAPDAPAARPLTPTETALAAIWRSLLKLRRVEATDHFFAIGGDSLAAVQLAVEVEAQFGIPLPVGFVFKHPTLEDLAARIDGLRTRQEKHNCSPFIVPLREVPGSRPFFFCEANLGLGNPGAWALPCSLYGIVSWATGVGFFEADSIASIAASHLREIIAIQPEGPYRLAGYSFGSLVALEIAHQLQEQGREVEILFLLDPMEPFLVETAAKSGGGGERIGEALAARGARHARALKGRPLQSLSYLLPRVLGRIRTNGLFQWLAYKAVQRYGTHPGKLSRRLLPRDRQPAYWFYAKRLAKRSPARRFPGNVLAVFSERPSARATWSRLVPETTRIHTTDVSHAELYHLAHADQWMGLLGDEVAMTPR